MHYTPTIPALILRSYRCFLDHGLTALLLAVAPALVSGWVTITVSPLHEDLAQIGLVLAVALLQLIYILALLRALQSKTRLYWPYRFWRDELRAVLASFFFWFAFALPLWGLTPLLHYFGVDPLVGTVLLLVGVYAVALRMVLLLPLIVVERKGVMDGIGESWGKTKGLTLKLLVAAVVVVAPWELVIRYAPQWFVVEQASDMDIIVTVVQSYLSTAVIGLFSYAVYDIQNAWAKRPEPGTTAS